MSNKKLDKQYDVKRLGRVVTKTTQMFDIFYHMDSSEYKRMRDYIYGRFGFFLPHDNPSVVEVTESA